MNHWFSFDTTTLARKWVAAPESNFGMLLTSTNNIGWVTYIADSCNAYDSDYYPRLVVSYVE